VADLNFLGCAPLSEHARLRQLLRGRSAGAWGRKVAAPRTLDDWEQAAAMEGHWLNRLRGY